MLPPVTFFPDESFFSKCSQSKSGSAIFKFSVPSRERHFLLGDFGESSDFALAKETFSSLGDAGSCVLALRSGGALSLSLALFLLRGSFRTFGSCVLDLRNGGGSSWLPALLLLLTAFGSSVLDLRSGGGSSLSLSLALFLCLLPFLTPEL